MIYQNKKTLGVCLITVFCAVLSLSLNYFFIPCIGPLAAGFSNLITGLCMFCMSLGLAKRNYYIPLGNKIIIYTVVIIMALFTLDDIIENVYVALLYKTIFLLLMIYIAIKVNIVSRELYPIVGRLGKKLISKLSIR